MAALHQEEVCELRTRVRVALRAQEGVRTEIEGIKLEVATEVKSQLTKVEELEGGFKSLDAWADDVATNTDPEAL